MNENLIKKMGNKKKKGFTLVELIIVIAIIAILAAMVIPKFGAVIMDSKVSNDIAAAKNIQSGVAICIANGSLPNNKAAFDPTTEQVVKDRIDGAIKPKAGSSTATFLVTIKDGDVTVASSDDASLNLAPADDNTAKDYRDAVKTK